MYLNISLAFSSKQPYLAIFGESTFKSLEAGNELLVWGIPGPQVTSTWSRTEVENFLLKKPILKHTFEGFTGHIISATATQLCHYYKEIVTDNI